MKYLTAIRDFIERTRDAWDNREEHLERAKTMVRELPERYRSADPVQRRNLNIAIGIIVALQIIFII